MTARLSRCAAAAAVLLLVGAAASLPAEAGLYRVDRAGPAGSSGADRRAMLEAVVLKVVDGDTIKVSLAEPPRGLRSVETVRLIGVDTPEIRHPKKKPERGGREAAAYTAGRLLGKRVKLAFDRELRDRYDRLLAYVYPPAGACHNAELIVRGYGRAYLKFRFQFKEEFRRLEEQARLGRKGLWK